MHFSFFSWASHEGMSILGDERSSSSGIQAFKAASVFSKNVSSASSCIFAIRSIDRRREPYFPGLRVVTTKLSNSFLFDRRYLRSLLRRLGDRGLFDNCEKSNVCLLLVSAVSGEDWNPLAPGSISSYEWCSVLQWLLSLLTSVDSLSCPSSSSDTDSSRTSLSSSL